MKIAYLVHAYSSIPSGVIQKIQGQVNEWVKTGHEFKMFILAKENAKAQLEQEFPFSEDSMFEFYQGKFGRFSSMKNLCARIIGFEADLIYYRYDLYYPALSKLSKCVPVITEINTDDLTEYNNGSSLFEYYNKLTRGRLFNNTSGLVFVTNELRENRNFAKYNNPSVVIGNGIDLDEYPSNNTLKKPSRRLFFIGTDKYVWHGLDKLIELARRLPQFEFDIVGKNADHIRDLPKNMKFYGHLTKEEYLPLAMNATVAVSSLAFHRIGLNEASPLKTREYLACNLPTILAYKDTDFPESADFLLQLPNHESNIAESVREIVAFIEKWQEAEFPKEKITHLDNAVKEKERLEFFEQIIESRSEL